MKTTGIFTANTYDIPLKSNRGKTEATIIPFGDVHAFAPLHDKDKWLEDLENWKQRLEDGENIFFIGMGDYLDLLSTSERVILQSGNLHDSTTETLDNFYTSKIDEFCNQIAFMQGRLIGFLEGNHYVSLTSGITSTQYIALKLKARYLGVSSFINLRVMYPTKKRSTYLTPMWCHHGLGGGRTLGASINKVEQLQRIGDASIYLMGHDHKKHLALNNRLYISTNQGKTIVKNRKILMARTGSYLMGYVDGKKSYVAEAAMSPADLGGIEIYLTMKRENTYEWVDISGKI